MYYQDWIKEPLSWSDNSEFPKESSDLSNESIFTNASGFNLNVESIGANESHVGYHFFDSSVDSKNYFQNNIGEEGAISFEQLKGIESDVEHIFNDWNLPPLEMPNGCFYQPNTYTLGLISKESDDECENMLVELENSTGELSFLATIGAKIRKLITEGSVELGRYLVVFYFAIYCASAPVYIDEIYSLSETENTETRKVAQPKNSLTITSNIDFQGGATGSTGNTRVNVSNF